MKAWMQRCLLLALACYGPAHAETLKQAYLDDSQHVHLVTAAGKEVKIDSIGFGGEVKLSPAGDSAAWLVRHGAAGDEASEAGSDELAIYRNGKVRSIKCQPFIREYWYWRQGSRIAIDCGGAHFAGREILYDSKTLKQLETFDQATVPTGQRPTWSSSGDQFDAK